MKRCAAVVAFAIALSATYASELLWPTESKAFAEGEPPVKFLQPTASGNPMSGAFGDVRNNGYKFHEGIDIRPVRRNRKGEALDEVYFAMDGTVRMINKIAGNSGYGRYVVVSHEDADVEVYTLYAHLSEIDAGFSIGSRVKAGQKVGIMGRSASYPIAKAQSHLHFEIGLRLGDSFDRWYISKKYRQKNHFGNFNGMNLYGFDPLAFFYAAKEGRINSGFAGYIQSLPTAFVVRVYTRSVPDFVKIYPALTDSNGHDCGWDIHFTWYGLPQKFERIKNPRADAKEGEFEIVKYNAEELKRKCRKMVHVDKDGRAGALEGLKEILRKIF